MFGDDARPQWGGDKFDQHNVTINDQHNLNADHNFYNRPYNGWHPNWSNGGYWAHRPWNAGWYRWAPTSWGWWGGSASAWGLAGLATGVAITELVNNAAAQQSTIIVVPQSDYQLELWLGGGGGDPGRQLLLRGLRGRESAGGGELPSGPAQWPGARRSPRTPNWSMPSARWPLVPRVSLLGLDQAERLEGFKASAFDSGSVLVLRAVPAAALACPVT